MRSREVIARASATYPALGVLVVAAAGDVLAGALPPELEDGGVMPCARSAIVVMSLGEAGFKIKTIPYSLWVLQISIYCRFQGVKYSRTMWKAVEEHRAGLDGASGGFWSVEIAFGA